MKGRGQGWRDETRVRLRQIACAAGLFAAATVACAAGAGDHPEAGKPEPYKQLPLRRDAEEGGVAWGVLAFLVVLGVAATFIAARARKGGRSWLLFGLTSVAPAKGAPPRIEVVERRSLNAACTVYLVRWDGEEMLLGCTSQAVSVISRRQPGAAISDEK